MPTIAVGLAEQRHHSGSGAELMGLNQGNKIVIVWDNATWRKNNLIRAKQLEGQALQDIHLINFPPYTPDHNPIEHVWNDAKNAISNVQRDDFESTVAAFEARISSQLFDYENLLTGDPF